MAINTDKKEKGLVDSTSTEQSKSNTINQIEETSQNKKCNNNFFKTPQQAQALNFINLPQHNNGDNSSLSGNCPQVIVCSKLGSGGCSNLSKVSLQRMKK